ncbi:MAG TPA: carbonic anhydrase [Pseudolabrys sp.]|nr:carbonic anhydrase [Pseudolabrys sp.]
MSLISSHTAGCTCCGDLLRGHYDRRRFLQVAGGATLAAAMPTFAFAASGNYEAMVLGCIDPRLQEPMHRYTTQHHLTGKFSTFIFAGAAIGVVADAFKDWRPAFWENLAASIQLHNIKKVIAIDHRDCGAAKIAYGDAKVASKEIETETHRAAMADFRKQLKEKHPQLGCDTMLMAIDGSVTTFT